MPTRIQRRRTRGWRAPEGAVYVGRGTRWGNPFRVGAPHPHPDENGRPIRDRAEAVDLFELHIGPMGMHEYDDDKLAALRAMAGRPLMCWCPLDQPCHANVLLLCYALAAQIGRLKQLVDDATRQAEAA